MILEDLNGAQVMAEFDGYFIHCETKPLKFVGYCKDSNSMFNCL